MSEPQTPEVIAPEKKGSTRELVEQVTSSEALARRDGSSWSFDPSAFALAQQQASALAASSLLPRHLTHLKDQALSKQQVIANCMFLVADAARWRVNPYALLPECYPRPGGGGMAYQGKVIAGILNKHLGIRLMYRWAGQGEDRTCICFAALPGELDPETGRQLIRDAKVRFGDVKTYDRDGRLKAAWTQDLDQKLSYNACVKWGRLHAPELVTGVITAEEAELMEQERRSAQLPTPPPSGTSGAPPPSLVAFAQAAASPTPEAGSSQAGERESAAKKGDQPIASRALAEIVKMAKDAGLSKDDLAKLARQTCEGRGLARLYDRDCLPMVQELQKLNDAPGQR